MTEKIKDIDLIIFYDDDADGNCAAAVSAKGYEKSVRELYEKNEEEFVPPVVLFQPHNRVLGDTAEVDTIKEVKPKHVVFVDYTPTNLEEIIKVVNSEEYMASLLVIDHHPTGLELANSLASVDGEFDYVYGEDLSAAETAWFYWFAEPTKEQLAEHEEFLTTINPMESGNWIVSYKGFDLVDACGCPTVVKLIGRYDVWDHDRMPHVLAFHHGIEALDRDAGNIPFWAELLKAKYAETEDDPKVLEQIIGMGHIIFSAKEGDDLFIMNNLAYETTFDGFEVLLVNAPISSSYVYAVDKRWLTKDFCMSAYFTKEGSLKVSMRKPTEPDEREEGTGPDLSVIASNHRGGGHPNAAGFVVPASEAAEFLANLYNSSL